MTASVKHDDLNRLTLNVTLVDTCDTCGTVTHVALMALVAHVAHRGPPPPSLQYKKQI